jgi:thioredoxin-related protein
MQWRSIRSLLLGAVCIGFLSGGPSDAQAAKDPLWQSFYNLALREAEKTDKVIMLYFSGSDWDPYSKLLDKSVIGTKYFRSFAKDKLIMYRADFPKETKQTAKIKLTNRDLSEKYTVDLFPTFIFIDKTGRVLGRAYFDEAKLRKEEPKGIPRTFVGYIRNLVTERPTFIAIKGHKTIPKGRLAALRKGLPMFVVITHPKSKTQALAASRLLNDPGFINFVNSTMVPVVLNPPEEDDNSVEARSFRAFQARNKLPTITPQLVMYDVRKRKVIFRKAAFTGAKTSSVIAQIKKALPKIDFEKGVWMEDYQKAKAIANQTSRTIMLSFQSDDQFSNKLIKEIYESEYFISFARDNLVLVKLDYAKGSMGKQSEALLEQNKNLADVYRIKGYPMMIFINAMGKQIAKAKYQKGGAQEFLTQLRVIRKADLKRQKSW